MLSSVCCATTTLCHYTKHDGSPEPPWAPTFYSNHIPLLSSVTAVVNPTWSRSGRNQLKPTSSVTIRPTITRILLTLPSKTDSDFSYKIRQTIHSTLWYSPVGHSTTSLRLKSIALGALAFFYSGTCLPSPPVSCSVLPTPQSLSDSGVEWETLTRQSVSLDSERRPISHRPK